jgi:hypothetical protein
MNKSRKSIFITALSLMFPLMFALAAKAPARAETVMPVVLKSFDKADPKKLTVEYENKSGKEINRIQGSLSFTDEAGKVLHTTGVTKDFGGKWNWSAGAKLPDEPFMWRNVPPDLIKALEQKPQSIIIKFTASELKYADGTVEKF